MTDFNRQYYERELRRRNEINDSLNPFYMLIVAILGGILFFTSSLNLATYSFQELIYSLPFSSVLLLINIPILTKYYKEIKNTIVLRLIVIFSLITIISFILLIIIETDFNNLLLPAIKTAFYLSTYIYAIINIILIFRAQINFQYQFIWTPNDKTEYIKTINEYVEEYYPNLYAQKRKDKIKIIVEEQENKITGDAVEINHFSNNEKEELISLFKREFFILVILVIFSNIIIKF